MLQSPQNRLLQINQNIMTKISAIDKKINEALKLAESANSKKQIIQCLFSFYEFNDLSFKYLSQLEKKNKDIISKMTSLSTQIKDNGFSIKKMATNLTIKEKMEIITSAIAYNKLHISNSKTFKQEKQFKLEKMKAIETKFEDIKFALIEKNNHCHEYFKAYINLPHVNHEATRNIIDSITDSFDGSTHLYKHFVKLIKTKNIDINYFDEKEFEDKDSMIVFDALYIELLKLELDHEQSYPALTYDGWITKEKNVVKLITKKMEPFLSETGRIFTSYGTSKYHIKKGKPLPSLCYYFSVDSFINHLKNEYLKEKDLTMIKQALKSVHNKLLSSEQMQIIDKIQEELQFAQATAKFICSAIERLFNQDNYSDGMKISLDLIYPLKKISLVIDAAEQISQFLTNKEQHLAKIKQIAEIAPDQPAMKTLAVDKNIINSFAQKEREHVPYPSLLPLPTIINNTSAPLAANNTQVLPSADPITFHFHTEKKKTSSNKSYQAQNNKFATKEKLEDKVPAIDWTTQLAPVRNIINAIFEHQNVSLRDLITLTKALGGNTDVQHHPSFSIPTENLPIERNALADSHFTDGLHPHHDKKRKKSLPGRLVKSFRDLLEACHFRPNDLWPDKDKTHRLALIKK